MAKPLRIDALHDEIVRRMVGTVAPELQARVERAVAEVKADAESRWPVGKRYPRTASKPHSRDLFSVHVELERSGDRYALVGSVRNSADYMIYIKPLRLGKSAVVEWIRKPMLAQRDQIRADLPDLVGGGLRRGR